MTKKEMIILLLKDHLTQMHLIYSLETLGFYSEKHYLHLTEVIFDLVGIERGNDELFEAYLKWCAQIKDKDILSEPKLLEKYAEEIYYALISNSHKDQLSNYTIL
jgi:hypothetical protein